MSEAAVWCKRLRKVAKEKRLNILEARADSFLYCMSTYNDTHRC